MPFTERQKRNAVAQFINGVDQATIAQKLGVGVRQLKRWVAAAKAVSPNLQRVEAPEEDPSSEASPSEKGPENVVLDAVLKDEAGASTAHVTAPTANEVAAAKVDIQSECVQAANGAMQAIGELIVRLMFSPPLDATAPEVHSLMKIGPITEMAVRGNAPTIYPILVKTTSNVFSLLLIGAGAVAGMVSGLEKLAKTKGWTSKKGAAPSPPKVRPAPVAVPTPEQYGESLKPPAAEHTIVDAPVAVMEPVN